MESCQGRLCGKIIKETILSTKELMELAKKADEFKKEEAPKAQTETGKELLENLKEGESNVFAGVLYKISIIELLKGKR